MRIGLNCLNISPHYSGGSNAYAFGLIEGFLGTPSKHSFQLYVTPENKHLFDHYKTHSYVTLFVINTRLNLLKKAIQFFSLITAYFLFLTIYKRVSDYFFHHASSLINNNSDIIYIPTTKLFPLNYTIPSVLSMHDIQHVHFPHFFSFKERLFRQVIFQLSARHATYLQASTTFIKQDLLKHFTCLSPKQIVVINEGVDIDKFSRSHKPELTQKTYNLPQVFLFYPAQLWHHKNHITVLKALLELKQQHQLSIPLILTGANSDASSAIHSFIKANNLGNIVMHLGVVPFEDLINIYHLSTIVITAALYESSSLPLLEACVAKKPVLASNIPSNQETAQEFEITLFNVKEPSHLATCIHTLWNDESLRKSQAAANVLKLPSRSWSHIAQHYITFFTQCIQVHI